MREREKEREREREREIEREKDCNYPQTQTFLIFFCLDSNEFERQSPATLKCKSMKRTLIKIQVGQKQLILMDKDEHR